MAITSVPITSGSGNNIAVDSIPGSLFAQILKLGMGAEGEAVVLVDSGQQTMANSLPVVIASDQSAIPVTGNIAHDAADSGNPVKMGAVGRNAEAAAVANGDRVNLSADLYGALLTTLDAPRDLTVSGSTGSISGSAATELIAAQGASVKTYLTDIIVTNGHATQGTFVNIQDGSTTKITGYAAAAGGGFAHHFRRPIPGTANTAWNVQCETAGATVRVSGAGFKGA
jgi:hypothetical protein